MKDRIIRNIIVRVILTIITTIITFLFARFAHIAPYASSLELTSALFAFIWGIATMIGMGLVMEQFWRLND